MPSSIVLTSRDVDLLDAYDSAFDPDPRLAMQLDLLNRYRKISIIEENNYES